jgi:hypothetical protein
MAFIFKLLFNGSVAEWAFEVKMQNFETGG